jgi:hypothetical protein
MFSALVSSYHRQQANVSFTAKFRFFPMDCLRCNADEQSFIFAPKFSARPHPEEPRNQRLEG